MTNVRPHLRRLTSALALLLTLAACTSFNTNNDTELAEDSDIEFNEQPATTPSVATDEGGGSMENETTISDIRYVSRKGGGTVVIESSTPLVFRTRENPESNQYVVDVANARLPDRLKRPYITKDFNQAIASVNAYQEAGSSTAHVVVTFRAPTRATTTQTGKKLLVFATGPASQSGQANADDSSDIDTLAKTAAIEGGAGDSRILPANATAGEATRFYGRPISIEIRDTNVRDVIQLIADQSGANIVLASNIEGKVTLKLKQIPWDQALMIVMKSQGLGYVRQGSVLRIATLAQIKAENDAAKAIIEAQAEAEPLKVKILPISYAKVTDLVTRVTPFLTPRRGAVVADERTSSLIVTDLPDVLDRISNLVKSLDTPPLQVQIEAKIIEAREDFTRKYGIQWGVTGASLTNGGAGIQTNNLNITPGDIPSVLNYNIRLGTFDILGDLDATLGLAETQNVAKVLSAPRITTLNSQEATVSQSTTLQIQKQTQGAAGNTVSYEQLDVPLELKVTPQVSANGDVLLKLNITRSFPGSAGVNGAPPQIEKRTVATNVMVHNGQTAVVGGVYQSDSSESDSGVPLLKNIPVFGWLFKSTNKLSNKNELLVFLTPRIINSDNAQKEGTF
jgi:type IV pilus assembly protein PilQ